MTFQEISKCFINIQFKLNQFRMYIFYGLCSVVRLMSGEFQVYSINIGTLVQICRVVPLQCLPIV